MAVLQCEICGGKLVGKPGGVFECDSCGMEYSTEWAKAKIQEIKGTVKVEGTVEVTGKVQVEGGSVTVEGAATKESLLKRVKMCCAEQQWEKADELLEQVLNIDTECAEAYLYSYMSRNRIPTPEELRSAYVNNKQRFEKDKDIRKMFRFAVGETAEMLAQWEQEISTDLKQRQEMRDILKAKRKAIGGAKQLVAVGSSHIVGLRSDGTVIAAGSDWDDRCDVGNWKDIVAISCGDNYTIGLHVDGTVVITGEYKSQFDVENWRDIVAVDGDSRHMVGLRADGTVAVVSHVDEEDNVEEDYEEYEEEKFWGKVSDWSNIVSMDRGEDFMVGLRADGTVAVAENDWKIEDDVEDWMNIASIVCSNECVVGLRTDGTVAVAYRWWMDECEAEDWQDIVAIDCGYGHIVGLCADGTVVAMVEQSCGDYDQCNVDGWRDIVMIACGNYHTVGLRADGTVVATGMNDCGQCNVDSWRDIVAIVCGRSFTVGVHTDGTVIVAGDNDDGACNTSKWKLFNSIDTLAGELEESRKAAKAHRLAEQKAEEERRLAQQETARAEKERELAARGARRAELEQEKKTLRTELAGLKGIFSGKRRRDIEARLAQIETELESYKED